MSNKNNENQEIKKLKEEIISQIQAEQLKYFKNFEKKIEESNSLINESNKKFSENKAFFENILSQKYYFEKLDNHDKIITKINDILLAHEIKLSKISEEINSLRTKYDKAILDNLLLPGQIGPSCQYKNLSQYLKNNIYDMTRMKTDNENLKNLSSDLKTRFELSQKNVTNLIDSCVQRANLYTDSRINDFSKILESKMIETNEKLMEIRMKNIQSKDKYTVNITEIKNDLEERIQDQEKKLNKLNQMLEKSVTEGKLEKLKNKVKNIKELLLNFIGNYQNQQGTKRRNSVMNGFDFMDKNKRERILESPLKNIKNDSKITDLSAGKQHQKVREMLSPLKQRKSTNVNINNNNLSNKMKSDQKIQLLMQMVNISEDSDDNNDSDSNINIKKNLNQQNDEVDKSNNKEQKTNKNNKLDKLENINKNKFTTKIKNIKNASKFSKNENSNSNSFESISDSEKKNNSKEKINKFDSKQKIYSNRKNTEKLIIAAKAINPQEKNNYNLNNNNNTITNNTSKTENYPNNFIIKPKNIYQSNSRNPNNSINLNPSLSINSPQRNYNRTQQEEKDEIIKDFFTKYDKNLIAENLSLIKNRGNLDLYNYSISPPDNNHFLNTRNDEIYNPPLSKELFFSTSKSKNNNLKVKNNLNNKFQTDITYETNSVNNKKVGTINTSSERKMYLSNNDNFNNIKYIKNRKMDFHNKLMNYYPDNIKKNKMYTMTMYKK